MYVTDLGAVEVTYLLPGRHAARVRCHQTLWCHGFQRGRLLRARQDSPRRGWYKLYKLLLQWKGAERHSDHDVRFGPIVHTFTTPRPDHHFHEVGTKSPHVPRDVSVWHERRQSQLSGRWHRRGMNEQRRDFALMQHDITKECTTIDT